jgi:DnaJ like chaperone protein
VNIWGKLIGAVLGYMVGGLFGLLIGVALGHQFDRGLASLSSGGGWAGAGLGGLHHAEIQQAFFEATFSVMGHVAKADGRVSEQEIALARQVMARLGLTEQVRRQAIDLFTRGKQADFDLEAAVTRFHYATRHARNLRQMFIEIQLHAAYADADLNPAERHVLLTLCDELGFSSRDFDRLDAMVRAELHAAKGGAVEQVSLDDAYAILNVTAEAGDAEVKRAYRKLTNQHHPDKLVAKGLPEEMMKLAEEKTREIRAAYERIREVRGF